MGGYNPPGHGGTEYGFSAQSFSDGFGFNDGIQGFNMPTGQTHEAWLLAQNLGGILGFGTSDWNFGGALNGVDTALRRPTDHLLPTLSSSTAVPKVAKALIHAATSTIQTGPEVNGSPVEELGTRIRKPAARKEVMSLTEVTNSEGDGIPEWMVNAIGYLKDGLGSKEWLDCVDVSAEFEKKIGLQNSISVNV
jgi:hypothetical protein